MYIAYAAQHGGCTETRRVAVKLSGVILGGGLPRYAALAKTLPDADKYNLVEMLLLHVSFIIIVL